MLWIHPTNGKSYECIGVDSVFSLLHRYSFGVIWLASNSELYYWYFILDIWVFFILSVFSYRHSLQLFIYIYGVRFLYQSSHHYWFSSRISEDWSNLYHEKWYNYQVFYHRISPQAPKEFVIDLSYQTAHRKHAEGHYLWISCWNFEDEIHF